MSAIRRLGAALLSILLIYLLSGCWSSYELNERAFARIMVLDKADDGRLELTLGFPLTNRMAGSTTGGGPGITSTQQPFTFVTKKGRDLGEAYRLIQNDLSRQITFGQLRNILISKAFAQEGLLPLMDFLNRHTEIHINANMLVTDGPAIQIRNIPLTFERFPTEILTAYSKLQITLAVTVRDVLTAILEGDGDFILPALQFGKPGAEMEPKGRNWMSTDGAAIFHHGKWVDRLDSTETQIASWIMGRMGENVIRIESPTDGMSVDLFIYGSKGKIKPILKGGRIRFDISCQGFAKVIGSESLIDLTDRNQLHLLEKNLNREMQKRIRSMVSHLQASGSDVFELGQRIRWRNPREWNRYKDDWRNVFKDQIAIGAISDVKIKWHGGAQKPLWNKRLSEMEENS